MSDYLENPNTMELSMEIPESLYQLIDVLNKAGHEAFVVGGAVRDTLLGRSPKDYDISTSARPEQALTLLDPYVKFAGVQGEKSFAVARVVAHDGNEYEFAPYRSDEGTRKGGFASPVSSIKEDVLRRDLTINALFYRPPTRGERKAGQKGEVIDYVGGIEDIQNEVIRTVGDPERRFSEDRLRILRAFRFAGRVGGQLDQETADAIKKNNSLTEPSDAAVSSERIKEELIKGILSAKIPADYINMLIDFGLLSQILPGLDVSRAFSSSKNIAIQLATILPNNSPSEVSRVLASKNFGNDIKNAVSFLLCLDDIGKDTVFGLKKECERIKRSSSVLINDQIILEFGMALGKDFSKFVEFANSPPAISAKELMEKGMKPGPDIGRAIRDAEVDAYYKDNLGDIEDISASHGIVNKLVKLSILLERFSAKEESGYVQNIIKRFADTDYFVPNISGHVYIFDMDDTLFWSPEWHDVALYTEENIVESARDDAPNVINSILEFVRNASTNPEEYIRGGLNDTERSSLLEHFKEEVGEMHLRREIIDIPLLGKTNQVVFVLKDKDNMPIPPSLFKKFFASRYTKKFDLREKYLQGAVVVAGDHKFYQSPKTLGIIPNKDILDIYNKHSDNAVILTARESTPGMEEGILDRLKSVGSKWPRSVYTKPIGEASGKYKGEVIGRIASQDSVEKITFYDDNLKYINSIKKVLEEKYSNVKDKVSIIKVDTSEKPAEGLLKGDL